MRCCDVVLTDCWGCAQLTYEELRHCIADYGYEFMLERQMESRYTDFPRSMMHTVYNAMQFTVQKPL